MPKASQWIDEAHHVDPHEIVLEWLGQGAASIGCCVEARWCNDVAIGIAPLRGSVNRVQRDCATIDCISELDFMEDLDGCEREAGIECMLIQFCSHQAGAVESYDECDGMRKVAPYLSALVSSAIQSEF